MDNSEITGNNTSETPETNSVSTPKSSDQWLKIVLLGILGLITTALTPNLTPSVTSTPSIEDQRGKKPK